MENVEYFCPLSPMQQGMLFHSLYEPESGVYFEQVYCLIKGLNAEAWKRAWQQVLDRHSILRTAFIWEDVNEPVQVAFKSVPLPCRQYDLRWMSPSAQEEVFQHFLAEDRELGFDLSAPPLTRIALLQLSDNTYQFVWTHHHILLDGWSTPLLVKEVICLYQAECNGLELDLDRPRPYRDYIVWLQRQDAGAAASFWRNALNGFTSPTHFGIERTSEGGSETATDDADLSEPVTNALLDAARSNFLTINTLVQAGWAVLLNRYGDQFDVVFGTTTAGRPPELAGVESMLGLFINTIPVRVRIDPREPLIALLKRLQEDQAEARQFDYSPLVDVQGWSDLPAGVPLFENILVLESYPFDDGNEEGGSNVELEISNVSSIEWANYPLAMTLMPGRELSLQVTFHSSRFDSADINRLLAHFKTLLEKMPAHLAQPVGCLTCLSEAERSELLAEHRRAGQPVDLSVCQLFEEQVDRAPDAIAAYYLDQSISYLELESRINQLAHYLRRFEIKAETLAAIHMESSLEVLVGILGVLKAGGAYVPLDPVYPDEQVKLMIEDSRAAFVLTRSHLAPALPPHNGRTVLLDAEWNKIACESAERPGQRPVAEALAYAIFTSGSTGRPKAAMISHKSLANYAVAAACRFELQPGDRFLQFASLCFDVSVEEIFPALSTGAAVVMVTEIPSPEDLSKKIEEAGLTVIELPTTYWHEWVNELAESSKVPECLRLVIIGGENAEPQKLARWQTVAGGRDCLMNVYGLTETTVTTTTYRPSPQAPAKGTSLPVGRPLPGSAIYILDRQLEIKSIGVPGEVFIGGETVGRGYLGQPLLTAERFVPDPYSETAGARLYRTGDIARTGAQHRNVEFLGRNDQQVKIRGYRIEPGEIEAVLNRRKDISQSVVLPHTSKNGDKNLVAFVVPHGRNGLSAAVLRDYLEKNLPDFMMPASFVLLDRLPVTANGKIDRRGLIAGAEFETGSGCEFVAPGTPVEEKLAAIWMDVLAVDRVGAGDHFFDLGGHSLSATRIVSRVRSEFDVELPLRQLFTTPTVRGLAGAISLLQKGPGDGGAELFMSVKAEDPERLLSSLDQLSGEQIDALLGEMLSD